MQPPEGTYSLIEEKSLDKAEKENNLKSTQGTAEQEEIPTFSSEDNETEVKLIDEHLSRGFYAAYKVLLYLMIITGIFTSILMGFLTIVWPFYLFITIYAICQSVYGKMMLGALKMKKSDKIRRAIKIAGFGCFWLAFHLWFMFNREINDEPLKKDYSLYVSFLYSTLLFVLLFLFPALKIERHIQLRNALLQSEIDGPFNA